MNDVIYLLVPAEEGEKVEQLGAHWDPVHLRWYIHADEDPAPFLEWLPIEEIEEDEALELCIAPPIYVAETTAVCSHCGSRSPVIALGAEKFHGADGDEPNFLLGKGTAAQNEAGDGVDLVKESFGGDAFEDEDEDDDFDEDGEYRERAGLMRFQLVKRLPAELLSLLGRRYPFYRKTGGEGYFENVCTTCGEPFDDLELHSEPGVGFYPFTVQEAENVVLRELPFAGPLLIEANFSQVVPDLLFENARREAFPADS